MLLLSLRADEVKSQIEKNNGVNYKFTIHKLFIIEILAHVYCPVFKNEKVIIIQTA